MSLFKGLDTPFFDSTTGEPLAFGFVYFGMPNQNAIANPKVPYANQALTTPLAATQELTIAGKFAQEVWLSGDYSVIITDADGVQQTEYLIVPQEEGGGGSGVVETIVAGSNVSVDSTDPANPVVSASVGVTSITAGFGVSVTDPSSASPTIASDFSASNTAASYTLATTNDGQWMDLTGSSTINITCPPESSVDLGDKFVHIISNYSSGTVTIVAGSGVTVRPPPGGTLVVPQYATVGIKKADYTTNTYIVFGPTTAA